MLRHLVAAPSGSVMQCSCLSSPLVVVVNTLRALCLLDGIIQAQGKVATYCLDSALERVLRSAL